MAEMKTVAAVTSLVFTLGLVCLGRPGFAQQPDSAVSAEALKKLSIEQLMNLQVTSVSKRPEPLSQTASAIQVITPLTALAPHSVAPGPLMTSIRSMFARGISCTSQNTPENNGV